MRDQRKLLVTLAATIGLTAGAASSEDSFSLPFGPENGTLLETEAMIDAARAFEKVDVNQDGIVDIDEYAAQRVVYAQLARFNRLIVVDGVETFNLPVPNDVPDRLEAPERAAIDAVARRDFHMKAMEAPGLDEAAWQDVRLESFRVSDRDGDGVLRGRELASYVRSMAGEISAGFPAS